MDVAALLCGWCGQVLGSWKDLSRLDKAFPSSEFRSCVKVKVDVLDSLSLIVLMVSVDIK